MKNNDAMERFGKGEVKSLFPEYKKFFDYVAGLKIPADAFSGYIGADTTKYQPVVLPDQFQSILREHAGAYFIVAEEDRRGSYYAAGTRGRSVRLSSVPRRAETDDRVREIEIREIDPLEGNAIDFSVTDSVKNKSVNESNQAGDAEVHSPSGRARFVYRVNPQGERVLQEMQCDRVDEGLFQFGGATKAVRWVRDLEMSVDKGLQRTRYKDYYIIGRSNDPRLEVRFDVTTELQGDWRQPEETFVRIGYGAPKTSTVLVEDAGGKFRVEVYPYIQPELVKKDPVYAPLFALPVEREKFVNAIASRIAMLRDEWDKPQSVYASPMIERDNRSLE